MLLGGKNIIITGSGRGIGKAIAIACAKEGANIGLTARTIEELNATKNTFKAAYPYLKKDDKNDKARFIITGSEAYPNAPSKLTAYVASKYAVVGMQKAMATEYKRENITFNMVLPTQVDTSLLRGKKAGDGNKPPHVLNPRDLNDFYIFLLSDDANKIDNALMFTWDFFEIKKMLGVAPSEKRESWEAFKDYLADKEPKIYENVKNLGKFVDFIINRAN